MKVVLVSLPFEGHLPPIAALGNELHKKGYQVELWTAPKGLPTLERLAPDCKHCVFPHAYTPEEEQRVWSRPPPKTPWDATQRSAIAFGEKHHVNPFRCIDESVSTSRPDLIIADFLTFGAWDVAEKHKIPLVIAVTCPISVAINIMGAYELWRGFKTPAEGAMMPVFALPGYRRMNWAQRLLVNPFFKMYFPLAWRLWAKPIYARGRKKVGLPAVTPFRGTSPNTQPRHMVLLMTIPQLEEPMKLPPHWHVCSVLSRDFSTDPPPLPEGDEIRTWLEEAQAAGDHVVYVAFGSVAMLNEKQVLALATAFLALSDSPATLKISLPPVTSSSSSSKGRPPGIRFLWSIKDAAAKFLPRGLPKNKILTRPWVAQPSILAHPAVSLFVTHAGLNSLMEGLSVGKPLFALPRGADQYINAQHLINKGVGESIPSEQMTVRSLISGVTKILCDSSYKDRASHMSDSIRASPGMMQQALDTILGFAQGGATAGNA